MWTQIACEALRQKKLLQLTFDGGVIRVFEVHAVGYSSVGHPLIRAWQVRAEGAARERAGWKLVRLDEAVGAEITAEAFVAVRAGHRRGDRSFERILSEL